MECEGRWADKHTSAPSFPSLQACQAAVDQIEKRNETFKAAVQGPEGNPPEPEVNGTQLCSAQASKESQEVAYNRGHLSGWEWGRDFSILGHFLGEAPCAAPSGWGGGATLGLTTAGSGQPASRAGQSGTLCWPAALRSPGPR